MAKAALPYFAFFFIVNDVANSTTAQNRHRPDALSTRHFSLHILDMSQSTSTSAKLLLLADQTQISINERNRMKLLSLEPSESEEREIRHSFQTLHEGIQALQDEGVDNEHEPAAVIKKRAATLDKLKRSYKELLELYKQDETVDTSGLDLDLTPPRPKPAPAAPAPKHVRFRENLVEDNEPHPPGRKPKPKKRTLLEEQEELFIKPYKDDDIDEPPTLSEQAAGLDDQAHLRLQQDTMRDQDEHLDRLALSVSRQHELSMQISTELDSHLELLDEVDDLTEGSTSRLATARRRLDTFSKKAKNNGSMLTIAILFLIFIILLIVLK